jgi:hypothetical protein
MPRECPPAFHSERAAAGTDSTKRTSAPRPSAIAPVSCHARCCASRAEEGCRGCANLAGLIPRHNRGRRARNQDDGAVVPALPASLGWRQRVQGLAVSRCDWLRSVEWQEEPRDHRRLDDVCCPAWPGRSRLQPPKTARIELPSTTVRDQSICP